ncbi:MAG: DUF4007 family protein [Gammaproteobacteria bacterium]|nr:MAG: DUF4007 family protein [Gammaproteobacteria bacterium]
MPFGKHETFYLRDGWLSKGLAAIQRNPRIFREKDAPVQLGIGRNMVRSLSFWMLATGLAERTKDEERILVHTLTPFGQAVWEYDQYLENEGTLWLVHYHLVCSREQATTWYWLFNHFAPTLFDKETFLNELGQWVIAHQEGQNVSPRTLERDFQVFLHTYLPGDPRRSPEDTLESPLTHLGLLAPVDKTTYRLCQPSAERIPPLVVLYVLLQERPGQPRVASSLNLLQALRKPMSVGRVFNLNAAALVELLQRLERQNPEYAVRLVRTGGLDQLQLPSVTPAEVLTAYFRQR